MKNKRLPPGSEIARKKGCKCPIWDNSHGKGRGGNGKEFGWVVSGNCELHWEDKGD